jgi:hypothetical protein
VYVPIAETKPVRDGFERFYDELRPALSALQQTLPPNLIGRRMHLDPDFATLTYGDQGRRASRIQEMAAGDLLIFYASLRAVGAGNLVYAVIGVMVIDQIIPALEIPHSLWAQNAHTRRIPSPTDIVVRAIPEFSGRLEHCLPIGEYRERAYRVTRPLLKTWGGLSVKNGYLQRSARLPKMNDPGKFYAWLKNCGTRLVHKNN